MLTACACLMHERMAKKVQRPPGSAAGGWVEELGAEFWPSCPPSSTPPDLWEEGRAAWELGVRGKSGRRLLALALERWRAGSGVS